MKLLTFFQKSSGAYVRSGTTKVDELLDELRDAGVRGRFVSEYEEVFNVNGYEVHVHHRFGTSGLPYAWLVDKVDE